ncbi:MAG: class I SAM-dependent methyltransferase [Rhodobacteraceae bacterium]|nr:class I SAM-dependent methyltransferase [Paracoccaceae bacterium]
MSGKEFSCVLCNSGTVGVTTSDFVKGDKSGTLAVVECGTCGHCQLNPPFYSSDFYEKDGQVNNVIENYGTAFETIVNHSWVEARRRFDRFADQGIDLPAGETSGFTAIDVGGGYGFFGNILANKLPNAEVLVLDPSKSRIEKGRELMADLPAVANLDLAADFLDDAYAEQHRAQFDLVTMWHVLEHLDDPVGLLRNAFKLLRKGGTLCVEVPNRNDELMALSPAFRDRWFMVEHISYFTPALLEKTAWMAAPDASIKVTGYQRYGIFNYFHWVHFNKPQGENPDLFEGKDRLWIETTWRAAREAACTSDALFMTVKKLAD